MAEVSDGGFCSRLAPCQSLDNGEYVGPDRDRDGRACLKTAASASSWAAAEGAIGPMEPAELIGTVAVKGGYERHIKALQVACIISCVNDERSERLAFADVRYLQVHLDRVHARGRYGQGTGRPGPAGWLTGMSTSSPPRGSLASLVSGTVSSQNCPDTSPPRAAWNCDRAVSLAVGDHLEPFARGTMSRRLKANSVFDADGKPTSISLKPIFTSVWKSSSF